MKRALYTAVMALTCIAATADAQTTPPAKGIDFTAPIILPDGKPMKDGGLDLTRGSAVAACLVMRTTAGQGPALYALSVKVAMADAKNVTLNSAEQHAIIDCLNDGKHPAVIAGQIIPLIDPKLAPEPLH